MPSPPEPPSCHCHVSLHDALPISPDRGALQGIAVRELPRGRAAAAQPGSGQRRTQLPACQGAAAAGLDPRLAQEPAGADGRDADARSEEHTSELQSLRHLVCRLLLSRHRATAMSPYTTLFRSRQTEALFKELQCVNCHVVGQLRPNQDPASAAPNFLLAKERLRPDWIPVWLKNPQALMDGTRMPDRKSTRLNSSHLGISYAVSS